VVAHQAISPQHPVETFACARHAIKKRLPILIVDEDRLARVAARHHVIAGAGELDSERAGHCCRVSCVMR